MKECLNLKNTFVHALKTEMLQNLHYCLFTGTLPAIFIIEAVMQRVAEALGVPPEDVKAKNLYDKGQVKEMHIP